MNWTDFLRQQDLAAGTGQPLDLNSLSELSDKAIIDITGTDAIAFLHGQFTGHIESLTADQAMLTAWCNPKGRVLATMLLYRRDDGLRLLVSADQHAALLKRLQMFVLRSQVTLTDHSLDYASIGVSGNDATRLLAQHMGSLPDRPWHVISCNDVDVIQMPMATTVNTACRYLLTGPVAAIIRHWQQLEHVCQPAAHTYWHRLDIEAGLPQTTTATTELFLPQELNLDHLGGLHYQKGCYPGQEIVARLHFRGELKQQLRLASTPSPLPAPATPLYAANGQRVGTVLQAAGGAGGAVRLLAVAAANIGVAQRDNVNGASVTFTAEPAA